MNSYKSLLNYLSENIFLSDMNYLHELLLIEKMNLDVQIDR